MSITFNVNSKYTVLPVFDQKLVADVLHAISFGRDGGRIYIDVMVHTRLKPSTGPLSRKLTFTCKRKRTVDKYA